VDKRNESLQLVLESAEALEAARSAAPAAELPLQMDLEGQGDYIPSGASEDAGIIAPLDDAPHPAERGDLAVEPNAIASAPPEEVTSISIIRSRIKAGSNGNGNGHANGNGNDSAFATPAPAHSLRLYLPRTNDFDADVLLMQKIDRVLRQSTGDDNVIIHMPNKEGIVLLQPRHKVRCTDELLGALRSELGAEGVVRKVWCWRASQL
jgi:DNA polymerase-3 subunit alpha